MSDSFTATILKAQEGDNTAIATLISEYSRLILIECRKFGLDQHPDWSHEDLSQEVLIRVLAKIGQFDESSSENPQAAFEQWLRITTKNWLNNLERFRKAKKRFPETRSETFNQELAARDHVGATQKTASSIVSHDEEFEKVRETIDSHLTNEQKQIMELRVIEGLTLNQIAEKLVMSIDQVRYRFEQALQVLKKHL